MTAPNFVYVGASSPEALEIYVSPSTTVPDLTVVTAASMHITRPDKTTTTWTPTLDDQTTTTLSLVHVFAGDGSDVTIVGAYTIVAYLTTPGGVRRCAPVKLRARALTP